VPPVLPAHRFWRAIIVSTAVDDFTFFESVSRNRYQHARLFRDPDAARAWLLGAGGERP
jgi:hypothetical protein